MKTSASILLLVCLFTAAIAVGQENTPPAKKMSIREQLEQLATEEGSVNKGSNRTAPVKKESPARKKTAVKTTTANVPAAVVLNRENSPKVQEHITEKKENSSAVAVKSAQTVTAETNVSNSYWFGIAAVVLLAGIAAVRMLKKSVSLNLRRKIIVGALSSAVAMAVIGGLLFYQSNAVLEKINTRVHYDEKLIEQYSTVYASGLQMGQATRNVILNPTDGKAVSNHSAARKEVDNALKECLVLIAATVPDDHQKIGRVSTVQSLMEKDAMLQQQAQALAIAGEMEQAVELINSKETKLWREAKKIVLELRDEQRADMNADIAVIEQMTQTMWWFVGGTVAFAFAIIGFISLFFLRSVIGPIASVSDALRHADLNTALSDGRHDEIGDLMRSFDGFVSEIKDTLLQVSNSSHAVAHASSEINLRTEDLASGSQEQSKQSTNVNALVDEMINTITENSKNAAATTATARKARETAENGGAVVRKTMEGMKGISEVVNRSAETVKALGASSDQIGEIVTVIGEIADQTNLLALNAAIEAARAGDQGRGFAVVADEVRKLAERTTKATKEITAMIKQIQTDTHDAVLSMDEGTQKVEAGIVLAREADESLSEIMVISQTVTEKISQIAAASEEQSGAIARINTNVDAIGSVTSENARCTDQIARTSEDLHRLTVNLQELLAKFNLSGAAVSNRGTDEERAALRGYGASSKAVSEHGQLVEQ